MASRIPRTSIRLHAALPGAPRAGGDVGPPPSANEDDDPLATMMGEIVREFGADGVLITQHAERGDTVELFADGACEPARAHAVRAGIGDDDAATILTTEVPANGGTITVRTVFHRLSETGRARVRVASARLLPLLSPFARLWWQRRGAQARVGALTQAIERADIGVLLVDGRGQPTFTNAAARALLAEADGVRMTGAMLGGNTLADTLRLQAAVEHVITAGTADAAAPVVALPRSDRRPLMAAVMAQGTGVAGAIVYLFDPEQDLCTLIEPACKLYGLSPVETRLTCLLADGMSLAEAAETMRVREMTARSYLKQVFLKTDTNRQAELVWLMLKSTVRTRAVRAADLVATPV